MPDTCPVGCQKSAWPVSCSDGPGPAVGHDDHPCPCACSTSSSSGSATGWPCSAVQRPPKTPSCSCRGTRSPCCAAPIPGPGSTGPTAQSSPHSSGSCQQSCGRTGSSPPAPSCAGTAAWSPPGHPEADLSAPDGTAAGQRRDRRAHRATRHREPPLGVQEDPRRAPQARPPGWRIHHPPGPQGPEDPAGTETAHRHDLADGSAYPGIDDARHRLLPRRLRSYDMVRDNDRGTVVT